MPRRPGHRQIRSRVSLNELQALPPGLHVCLLSSPGGVWFLPRPLEIGSRRGHAKLCPAVLLALLSHPVVLMHIIPVSSYLRSCDCDAKHLIYYKPYQINCHVSTSFKMELKMFVFTMMRTAEISESDSRNVYETYNMVILASVWAY